MNTNICCIIQRNLHFITLLDSFIVSCVLTHIQNNREIHQPILMPDPFCLLLVDHIKPTLDMVFLRLVMCCKKMQGRIQGGARAPPP